jgi:hypothetical protein
MFAASITLSLTTNTEFSTSNEQAIVAFFPTFLVSRFSLPLFYRDIGFHYLLS